MDSDNRATQVVDLLPAYALGALDDDERDLVEEELAVSQSLRDQYRSLQLTADALAQPATLTAPPAALRDRVLASAGQRAAPVVLPQRGYRPARIGLVAAALLVLVLAGVIVGLWNRANDLDRQLADVQQAMSRPSTDFSRPLVWTALSAAASDVPVSGYFCRTEDGEVGWIVVEDMPVTDNHVYQLWLVDGERLVSAGTFATDAEGRGFGVVRAEAPVTAFQELWITAEPPGGSSAPSGAPRISVTIV